VGKTGLPIHLGPKNSEFLMGSFGKTNEGFFARATFG
jgi:hypothetical protein